MVTVVSFMLVGCKSEQWPWSFLHVVVMYVVLVAMRMLKFCLSLYVGHVVTHVHGMCPASAPHVSWDVVIVVALHVSPEFTTCIP